MDTLTILTIAGVALTVYSIVKRTHEYAHYLALIGLAIISILAINSFGWAGIIIVVAIPALGMLAAIGMINMEIYLAWVKSEKKIQDGKVFSAPQYIGIRSMLRKIVLRP